MGLAGNQSRLKLQRLLVFEVLSNYLKNRPYASNGLFDDEPGADGP